MSIFNLGSLDLLTVYKKFYVTMSEFFNKAILFIIARRYNRINSFKKYFSYYLSEYIKDFIYPVENIDDLLCYFVGLHDMTDSIKDNNWYLQHIF
jgi:hypothetical protein